MYLKNKFSSFSFNSQSIIKKKETLIKEITLRLKIQKEKKNFYLYNNIQQKLSDLLTYFQWNFIKKKEDTTKECINNNLYLIWIF